MSFQDDVESQRGGRSSPQFDSSPSSPSAATTQAIASGIFQINTAVASFYRLSNSLGTTKDTLLLRDKLHKTRLRISQLVKDTSAKLREASQADHHAEISPAKKIADAKLAKDFQSVLKEFQKAQRLAAERESTYAPFVPRELAPSSYTAQEVEISSSRGSEQQSLLLEPKRQDVIQLNNEIVFNEAIIEEREQGIQEIQQQINEVHEIFEDLAVLVREQGVVIDDISSNIESSHATTTQGTSQLVQASKLQKSTSSLGCLLLVIMGIILLIVVIVVVA
ncbi:syntaxin-22 [Eucalyptus grandis]|uniref:Uncharacterized protein n=2 Tax=Eucalyptus grandis TaxID=71139 RepID=A0ACC3M9W7_EUCGR|nr:syntaxin-22 [Eucalyptus grandis]KAK3447462.1 hypothetical protein EUGRSUZ_A02975 [Eucalyptus grandis]